MAARLAPALTLGLLATLNPCLLPLYPGFLAYLASRSASPGDRGGLRALGLLVLAGVLTMMLALGMLIAALSEVVGELRAFVSLLGDLIVITLGVMLILNVNPFSRLPQFAAPTGHGPRGAVNAFLYGLLYGPMTLPCTGSLAIGLFSLSLGLAGFIEHLLFFLIFGLGFGLPLLVLSLLAKSWQAWLLRQLTQRYRLISRASGLALIALGVWNFWQGWALLRLYVKA